MRFAVFVVSASVGCFAFGAVLEPVVDRSIALKVGDYSVSQYLVDKYFGRYVEGVRQQRHQAPSGAEEQAWLHAFVAKQCVIAYAKSLGFVDRPEVKEVVDRMERHMLTQSYGPYYDELFSALPTKSAEETASIYKRLGNVYDCLAVQFADAAQAELVLGNDFDRCSFDEQHKRVLQYRAQIPDRVIEGQMSWPFYPFSEIADALLDAPPGRWIKAQEPGLGLYYIFVRSINPAPEGRSLVSKDAFQSLFLRNRRQVFQKRRHQEILAQIHFGWEAETAMRFGDICSSLHSPNNEIPEAAIGAVSGKILFHYKIGDDQRAVSVESFCQHYNGSFVRSIPRTNGDLRNACEDMAVEEVDYRDAKARGVDQVPKFVEDKAGFVGFQVLDSYEKNVLITKVTISEQAIRQYYDDHVAQYSAVSEVSGRRLEFATLKNAAEWRRQQESKSAVVKDPVLPAKEEEIHVDLGKPVVGLEPLHAFIFSSPEDSVIGPLNLGPPYICFIKIKNLATTLRPLSLVSGEIRNILIRQALEVQELAVGQEAAQRLGLEDHIDYKRSMPADGKVGVTGL